MRLDGGLFRGTRRDLGPIPSATPLAASPAPSFCGRSFGRRRARKPGSNRSEPDEFLLDDAASQRERSQPEKAALIEGVEAPDGTDASPYYVRDLATTFFVQAVSRLFIDGIPA